MKEPAALSGKQCALGDPGGSPTPSQNLPCRVKLRTKGRLIRLFGLPLRSTIVVILLLLARHLPFGSLALVDPGPFRGSRPCQGIQSLRKTKDSEA